MSTVDAGLDLAKLAPLYQEGRIGSMVLRNRFVQSPIFTQYASTWGEASPKFIEYHRARARGGIGLIIMENTSIDWQVGRTVGNPIRLDHDRFRVALSELTEAVHNEGAKIAAQLHHTGRQNTRANIETGEAPISPSGGAASAFGDPPRGVERDEIPALIDAYAQAARRAKLSGFDAVEMHGAHGYLLSQFLSPKTNRRTDDYGGSFGNRVRFPLEVVAAVREQVGPDFPILYRLSVEEPYEGGLPLEEGLRFCEMLAERVDALDVSAGNYDTVGTLIPLEPPPSLLHYAKAVKARVRIPVIGVGRMVWALHDAAAAVVAGELDFVSLGRSQLAEPELVNKIRRGDGHRARRCIACNECIGDMFKGWRTPCTINPELGQEARAAQATQVPVRSKRVLVVGAGPAGCQAAILAAHRGHQVTVMERADRLGGQLVAWSAAQFRNVEIDALIRHYETELAALGVSVLLNQEPAAHQASGYDHVLLATGTSADVPDGAADAVRMLATRQAPVEDRVTVYGAGTAAAHAALWLAGQDKTVTLRCPDDAVATDVNDLLAGHLADLLSAAGVKVITNADPADAAGALIWAGPRRPTTDLGELVDDHTTFAIGTRLRGGLLYEATQSGHWTAARL